MGLLRVIVNDKLQPALVVTVYWTRDVSRYWSEP
jgi:hypothetical protein